MIHVGVSKDDHQISVEKRSFNDNYVHEDINSKCPEGQCCVDGCPTILETKLDVDKLCHAANENLKFLKSNGNLIFFPIYHNSRVVNEFSPNSNQ